jgi:hypothetical protein
MALRLGLGHPCCQLREEWRLTEVGRNAAVGYKNIGTCVPEVVRAQWYIRIIDRRARLVTKRFAIVCAPPIWVAVCRDAGVGAGKRDGANDFW